MICTFQEVDYGSVDDESRPEDGWRVDGDLAEVEALVAPPHRVDPQPVVVGRTKVQDEPVLGRVGPSGWQFNWYFESWAHFKPVLVILKLKKSFKCFTFDEQPPPILVIVTSS